MIDFRYHLASLAAVFLALGLGILIGTSMMGSHSVEGQIKGLRKEFDRIKEEDKRLHQENQTLMDQAHTLDNALRQVVPVVVRGRLTDKRVALILGGQGADAGLVRETKLALITAGAIISSITTFSGGLLPENAERRQALVDRLGLDATDGDRAGRQLAAYLVRQIVLARDPESVQAVGRLSPGILLDGDYTQPVDAVVFVTDAATEAEATLMQQSTSVQARIADALREQGIPSVICERQGSPASVMGFFARYSMATVDSLDTPLGKIALVYALGGKPGHYGTKPSAVQVLPDLDLAPPQANTERAPATSGRAPAPTHSLLPGPQAHSRPHGSRLPAPGDS